MRRYIIVYPNRDYGKLMWRDLEGNKNIDILKEPIQSKSKFLRNLFRIHFSFYINNKFNLLFKNIWLKEYNLLNFKYKKNNEYIIIMTDTALCNYTKRSLEYLKSNKNIKLVLFMINSFYRMKNVILPMLQEFDMIYTYDKLEAEKFGFKYYPTIYSSINIGAQGESKEIDCFFVGVAKGRLDKLITVYDYLESNGVKCSFFISGVKKRNQIIRRGIVYNTWLDYRTVLDKVAISRSILEVMDANNAGVTLRTLEAICYNKKLITDNQKIIHSDFYCAQYVYLINYDRLDGLVQFIQLQNEVNFNYDNRYSPKYFIDELDRSLQ